MKTKTKLRVIAQDGHFFTTAFVGNVQAAMSYYLGSWYDIERRMTKIEILETN